jgi:ferredoxin
VPDEPVPDKLPAWAIVVDRELCLGSGMCIVYAPGTFAHDEEAKAVVADAEGDPIEAIRTAVEACPVGALRLIESDGPRDQETEAR